jgi:phosphoribosyl 1,2-cyclic phosphate phosphodiesterase
VEYADKKVLIDVSQDFREQVLRENIQRVDAVLLTHQHADHIMGIPDIRSYSRIVENGLPIYGSDETITAVSNTFSYIFDPDTFEGGGIPSLTRHVVTEPFELWGLKITPLLVEHGVLKGCYGYRFGNIAYIPDVKRVPDETLKLLEGLDLLIIDCLRTDEPHSTHMILPESRAVVDIVKPKRTLLTHICHGIHYINDKKLLDETMNFAFDGLKLEI